MMLISFSADMQRVFDPVIGQIIELLMEQVVQAMVKKGARINVGLSRDMRILLTVFSISYLSEDSGNRLISSRGLPNGVKQTEISICYAQTMRK